jgi:hypothetical protein
MPEPPPWPQPHPYALNFDTFWVVNDIPPMPWPEWTPGDWALQKYGPKGTVWRYSWGAYLDRIYGTGFSLAANRLISSLREEASAVAIPLGSSQSWLNPGLVASPDTGRFPMRYIRTQIVQAVGTTEQAVHVLHWAPIGGDTNLDAAGLKAFGDSVRDSWATFLNTDTPMNPGGGGSSAIYRASMAKQAVYTEVRTSAVIQNGPGPWVSYGAGAQQDQHPGARAVQDGQTVISPFDPAQSNSTWGFQSSLPYEVALCITLNSNLRGSRFRGRLYLGPLSSAGLGDNGLFTPSYATGVGHQVGLFLDRVNAGGVNKAMVISSKFNIATPIQGTRAGVVPDSQRRRRRGLAENYVQAWGTPIGGAI